MTVHLEHLTAPVAVLTLDRPEALNALDVTALRTLRAAPDRDPGPRRYPRSRAHRRRHARLLRGRRPQGHAHHRRPATRKRCSRRRTPPPTSASISA